LTLENRAGVDEVRAAQWFGSVQWSRVDCRGYHPPFVPGALPPGDVSWWGHAPPLPPVAPNLAGAELLAVQKVLRRYVH